MRIQGLIFALIATGTVSAQTFPPKELLELFHTGDAEELLAASNAFDPAAYGFLAPVMAAWISSVRDDALMRGAEKIPNEIREELFDFVPQEILDSVRWSIEGRVLSIGQVQAATFDNVVLFANEDAAMDLKVWVHELFHVMQYQEWGVKEFSLRYIENRAEIENDAWSYLWQWIEVSG